MSSLTVRQAAERCAVSERVVLTWLNSGQLRGHNVARHAGAKRPTWRVPEEALAAFLAARTPEPAAPRTRRRTQAADVIQFY